MTLTEEQPKSWSRQARENWDDAEALWMAGEPVARISEKTGIPAKSIASKATRSKWTKRTLVGLQKKVQETIKPTIERHVESAVKEEVGKAALGIPAAIRAKLEAYFGRVIKSAEMLHDRLDEAADSRLEVEEIKSLSGSLDNIDRVTRRAFGLDGPDGQRLSAGLLMSTVTPVCPVIEGEVVDEVSAEPGNAVGK